MQPWHEIARVEAPDGKVLVLRQRGAEFLIVADGYDLMSSRDDASSRALAVLGCTDLTTAIEPRVLIGGLGMGFTLAAALEALGPRAHVEVAELVPAVVEWNRGPLAHLAGRPLEDPRTVVVLGDVGAPIRAARDRYDAILLDVDNGPDALAHGANETLYGERGIRAAAGALRRGGTLAIWSFSDDPGFTRRLRAAGLEVTVHRVPASRTGRGRFHVVWTARKR